jgi:hypothetical protein
MAHEMLYQRAVWLLLGAMLAVPALAASPAVGRPAAVAG